MREDLHGETVVSGQGAAAARVSTRTTSRYLRIVEVPAFSESREGSASQFSERLNCVELLKETNRTIKRLNKRDEYRVN